MGASLLMDLFSFSPKLSKLEVQGGALSCVWVASSVRYAPCFLECKVVALRDAFLTYTFVACAKCEVSRNISSCISSGYP